MVEMPSAICESHTIKIYVAGDIDRGRELCRQFCYKEGFCVNVTKNHYIYTGGEESGIVVEIVNYPRFTSTPEELEEKAYRLALNLREGLCQDSVLIVTPETTFWLSLREHSE